MNLLSSKVIKMHQIAYFCLNKYIKNKVRYRTVTKPLNRPEEPEITEKNGFPLASAAKKMSSEYPDEKALYAASTKIPMQNAAFNRDILGASVFLPGDLIAPFAGDADVIHLKASLTGTGILLELVQANQVGKVQKCSNGARPYDSRNRC